MTDLLGQPTKLQSPSILVFNLNTNELIKRFEIPKDQIKPNSFFVNIVSEMKFCWKVQLLNDVIGFNEKKSLFIENLTSKDKILVKTNLKPTQTYKILVNIHENCEISSLNEIGLNFHYFEVRFSLKK